jgi:hypothetical protein
MIALLVVAIGIHNVGSLKNTRLYRRICGGHWTLVAERVYGVDMSEEWVNLPPREIERLQGESQFPDKWFYVKAEEQW